MRDLRSYHLREFEKILSYRNYSESTKKVYISYVTKFLYDLGRPHSQITKKSIKAYLFNYNYSSISQQNQIISSLKLYSKYILKFKSIDKLFIERPRKSRRLPVVVDKDIMIKRISEIENLKHRAILSIAYSTGLRISEVRNLKIRDIDSKRMLILIRDSKFNKDRFVPLSPSILKLMRDYYKEYRPQEFLFNGSNGLQYSTSSLRAISNKYLFVNFHKIRHSALTAMMEAGTDLRLLQKIAGHSSSKTTEIYTHVSNQLLALVKTPI